MRIGTHPPRRYNVAYTVENYRTKKAVKEAVAAGEKVRVFQPGPFGPNIGDGTVALEGPHYPEAHMWYASAVIEDMVIVSIK